MTLHRPRRFITGGASLIVFALLVRPAFAIPPFSKEFQATYVQPDSNDPNVKKFSQLASSSETGLCLICHVKGEQKTVRNRYGAALAKLLHKENFAKKRLDAEPEKAKKEIHDALEKVAGQKSDPTKEDSPTFGQLIAQGKLPGIEPEEKPPATDAEKPVPPETSAAETSPPEPKITAPSPGGANQLAAQLLEQLKSELKAQVRAELEPIVREELRTELRAQLKAELKSELKDTLKAVVMAELNAPGPVPTDVEAEAIEQIRQLGGSVMPLAQNDDSKTVAFHLSGTGLTDEGLKYLTSVNKLVHLNLKDTQITDAGLAQIANITSLTRLNLARTQISDTGLEYLMGLDNLVYLNLYGSQVTDAGLEHLKGMTNLRKLFLWQSLVTEEGAKKLQEALPDCEVNY